jgi:hypothetical protein
MQFDNLPRTSRTLLLATLELEMAQAKCTNILDLAHKRHLSIQEIWRDVCRKTAQPRCSVPAPVMVSRDQWLASAGAAQSGSMAATSALETAASASEAKAGRKVEPAALAKQLRMVPVPWWRAKRGHGLRVPLMAGLAAVLALAIGLFALLANRDPVLAPQASLQVPNARPTDRVHGAAILREQSEESARQEFDASGLQPKGTMHRLDAISKSFSKR